MNQKKRKLIEAKKEKLRRKNSNKILHNILAFLVLLFLFNLLVSKNNGYQWMWKTLVIENLEYIKKNKNLSIAEKHEIKQGFFFRYLNFINANTPEDAIVLMPPDSIIDLVDTRYKLKTLKDKRKTTYFIYPRKAVYEKTTSMTAFIWIV